LLQDKPLSTHTNQNQKKQTTSKPLPDSRAILKNIEALNKRDRKIVLNLIKSLKDMEDQEKKA